MRKIAIALAATAAIAALSTTSASAYNLGPMIGRAMQGFARPMPRQAQVQQNHGTRVCKMCDDTSGGQQTQDCAGWAHNLHEQVVWENNCGGNRAGAGGVQVLNGGGREFRGNGVPTQQSTQTTTITWHTHQDGGRFTEGGPGMAPAGSGQRSMPPPAHISAAENQLLENAYK